MMNYYPLTYAQRAIWNVEKFVSNTSINNNAGTLLFNEELDFKVLEQAFNVVIKKTTLCEFVSKLKMGNLCSMLRIINTTNPIFST
jgi:hypothetical protein